jgi:DNA repair photolyase
LFPGEGRVVVYADTADRLIAELRRKRRKPTHVYFSPSTDVFQPVDEVLEMAYEMFATLLGQGVGIAFVTKGRIPERHMALLSAQAELVQVQIGVITPDEALARRLEPNAAPPALRFEQMRRLIHAGVKTRMRVAPIIPGLTDADETLDALFGHAASAGVTHATINALHLRPAIVASLRKHIEPHEAEMVLSRYAGAHSVHVCGDKSKQTPLARDARVSLFERARRIAKRHGIQAHVCGCMNPDLPSERCALAGDWLIPNHGQMTLFRGESG